MFADFKSITEITKLVKNFKSLYGFGGRCLHIRDVCMDFKVHNLVSVHPKSIKLGQMTSLNAIFQWLCQFIDLFKFETRPSSLRNFGMALQVLTRALLGRFIVTWQWLNLYVLWQATNKQLFSTFQQTRGYLHFSLPYYFTLYTGSLGNN